MNSNGFQELWQEWQESGSGSFSEFVEQVKVNDDLKLCEVGLLLSWFSENLDRGDLHDRKKIFQLDGLADDLEESARLVREFCEFLKENQKTR